MTVYDFAGSIYLFMTNSYEMQKLEHPTYVQQLVTALPKHTVSNSLLFESLVFRRVHLFGGSTAVLIVHQWYTCMCPPITNAVTEDHIVVIRTHHT